MLPRAFRTCPSKNGICPEVRPSIFRPGRFKKSSWRGSGPNEFDIIVLSPPCAGWSRAPWANPWGPRPLRAAGQHVWGFPWLEGARKQKLELSNNLVGFAIEAMELALQVSVDFIFEHPEELGAVRFSRHSARPASVWQLPQVKQMVQSGIAFTFAFFQCQLGATSRKPTRFLTTVPQLTLAMYQGWPSFSRDNFYQGPLPAACTCARKHIGIIKRHPDDTFATTAAQAYPPAMDAWMAKAIWAHFTAPLTPSLKRARLGAEGGGFQPASPTASPTSKPVSLVAHEEEATTSPPTTRQTSLGTSGRAQEEKAMPPLASSTTSPSSAAPTGGERSMSAPLSSAPAGGGGVHFVFFVFGTEKGRRCYFVGVFYGIFSGRREEGEFGAFNIFGLDKTGEIGADSGLLQGQDQEHGGWTGKELLGGQAGWSSRQAAEP